MDEYVTDEAALLDGIQKQLDEIKETLSFIKETMVKADATITKVADQVEPTIDGLLKSPLIKMLMPKGKS
jgi:hypothetical protein